MIDTLELITIPPEDEALRAEVRDFLAETLDGLEPDKRARSWMGFDAAFSRKLAERGWLEITPGDSATSTARLLPAPGAQALSRSEALALERVRERSRSMPTVPLSVLTDFEAEDRHNWMRRFTGALAAEAESAGLTRRRIRRALRYPLTLLVTAVGAGLNALADRGEFNRITRHINGGLNGLDDRLALWARAREVLC